MNTLFMDQLRSYCEARRIPLISRETQSFFQEILQEKKPHSVLEIGAAVGYSTLFIAQTIDAWNGRIASFEIGYHSYLQALQHIQQAQVRNITLYPFDINEIQLEDFFSQKFDFVFIDAQKSQYGDYMQKIQSHLCKECTILLDDVIKYQNKLDGLYSFLTKNQIEYQIFPTEPGDGVMLINYHKKESKKSDSLQRSLGE